MPAPKGTIVDVFSREDPRSARNGVVQRIGVAGIDLFSSWYWTRETRSTQRSLPIDRYRVMRPRTDGDAAVTPAYTRVTEPA
jgi:hypothetical protein